MMFVNSPVAIINFWLTQLSQAVFNRLTCKIKLNKKLLFQTAAVKYHSFIKCSSCDCVLLNELFTVIEKGSIIRPEKTREQLEHLNSAEKQKRFCRRKTRTPNPPLCGLLFRRAWPPDPCQPGAAHECRPSHLCCNYCWWPLPPEITQSVCRKTRELFILISVSEAFTVEGN